VEEQDVPLKKGGMPGCASCIRRSMISLWLSTVLASSSITTNAQLPGSQAQMEKDPCSSGLGA
jgi:hypothetical protein